MRLRFLPFLLLASSLACAQTRPPDSPTPQPPEDKLSATPEDQASAAPALPDIPTLMREVERNQQAAENADREYTYHVHQELTDLHSDGSVKETSITDSDSFTVDGVRVNKLIARDGQPLSADDARKESDKIDKQVAKAKAARAKLEDKGKPTNDQGTDQLTFSRALELGAFSNIRPGEFGGRPVWLIDFAGDPKAKTRNEFEGIIRCLKGTLWIDAHDHVLVAGHGDFFAPFKIGGGLLANIHAGSQFDFRATKVDSVWLPQEIDASGSFRYLLFGGANVRLKLVTSDYKRFRTGVTILPSNRLIGPDGNPLPDPIPTRNPPPPTAP
jgi:hypothetical protein